MDFSFTNEQQLLSEGAQRFMREQHSFQDHLQRLAQPEASHGSLWPQFAELGWLALPFNEVDGGLGCGAIEIMLLMQAFGRGLLTAPYLATVVVGGEIHRRAETSNQRQKRIEKLIDGKATLAVAYGEFSARYDLALIETAAWRTSSGWMLSGQKNAVLNGERAENLIVAARTSDNVNDRHGITLFFVPGDAADIERRSYPMLDGSRGADIRFNQTAVAADAVIGGIDFGLPVLEAAIDVGLVALGAEALGIMDALLEQTIAYCQTRVQFGKSIGSFQVLQHRLVDMFMETEQTRSLVYLATIRLVEEAADTAATQEAIAAMKVQVGKAGRFIGQEAIQLHGGMGMANDFIIGHYFKRLTAIDATFGNVDHHLKRFGSLRAARENAPAGA